MVGCGDEGVEGVKACDECSDDESGGGSEGNGSVGVMLADREP